MLRSVCLAATPAVIALAFAAPAVAQSTTIEGSFDRGTSRPAAATCAGVLCGTGRLEPFGDAGFVYVPATFEQISRSCAEVTASLEITLSASGDTLNLATESTACFAGNSPNTPGSLKSWGNPVEDTGRWTVESGTGIFQDATGEGTFVMNAAGAALHARLSGELELSG